MTWLTLPPRRLLLGHRFDTAPAVSRVGHYSILVGLTLCTLAAPAAAEEADGPDLTLRLGGGDDDEPVAEPAPVGLTLPDLVRLALDESYQVKASQAEVAQARALYAVAESLAYPRAEANAVFGGPTGEAKTARPNDIDSVTEASYGGDFNFGQLGVTLRGNFTAGIPLITFGKLEEGQMAAQHLVAAAERKVQATRGDVLVDLTRVYWGWQLIRGLVSSLEEGEKRLEGVLDQIEALLDAESSQVTENDRLRLKFALGNLSVRRAEAAGAVLQVEAAIRLLIGRPQSAPLELAEVDLTDAAPSSVPDLKQLIALARTGRPELQALRKVVAAQEAFRRLREAQLWPDVVFGGFVNFAFTSNATDQTNPFIYDPFNTFDVGLGLALRFELDVFTKLARIEQAEADVLLRKRQETFATEASEADVRRLHAQLAAELEQARRLERVHSSARGWLTSATLAYDIGAGRADELIDAFLAWATTEADLQTTRYESLVLAARLGRATGELVSGDTSAPN